MDYKRIIANEVMKILDIDISAVKELIEVPPKPEMGDFTIPCFKLEKFMSKAPNTIAEELKGAISGNVFERIEAVGPYLNFFIDKSYLNKRMIERILREKELYGAYNIGRGRRIVIESASLDILSPPNIENLFSDIIGQSLYRILSFSGFKCIKVKGVGDWGLKYGKLITAYKEGWINNITLLEDPIRELLCGYEKFHNEAKYNPEYEEKARKNYEKLQEGSDEEVFLWGKIKAVGLREYEKIYKRLNIHFDLFDFESFYKDKTEKVIKEIKKRELLKVINGVEVVFLKEYNMPPCVIKKNDEGGETAARALAAALYRKRKYDFCKTLYIDGTSQSIHLKKLFTTVELMGRSWSKDCIHIELGLIKFIDKVLAVRKGETMFLESLLGCIIEKTSEIRGITHLEDSRKFAEKIGLCSIIFTFLKRQRKKDILFNLDEILSFEGETLLFVQHNYSRGISVLRKNLLISKDIEYSHLNTEAEHRLVKLLGSFPEVVYGSVERYEPAMITEYIIDLCKAFDRIYSLLCENNEAVSSARIKMVEAFCQVIENGMNLLGLADIKEISKG